MRLSHDPLKTHASFDDPNLVSRAGLVPVLALAGRAGLADLVREHVSVGGPCGVNAGLKVACLVAGMAAGADSIEDLDAVPAAKRPAAPRAAAVPARNIVRLEVCCIDSDLSALDD